MEAFLRYEKKIEDDYYAIVGCDELSTNEQILAEYKAQVLTCHPDKHPDDPAAAERFAQLHRAKETLTDPVERDLYDCWKRSGICVPYPEWKARKDTVQSTMHWASRKKKEAMIDECSSSQRQQQEQQAADADQWQNDYRRNISYGWSNESASDILTKFRSYKI